MILPLESAGRMITMPLMKTNLLFLFLAVLTLVSCGGGGPATRVGRSIDNAFYHAGHGVKKAGQSIQNVAR
jgi:hypothetical protein